MQNVIQISLIGAGLVIVGLMVLWFMMALLVQLTGNKKKSQVSARDDLPDETPTEIGNIYQQKAAAAATAVAIALQKSSLVLPDQNNDRGVTPWQSTSRNRQMHNLPHKR